MDVLIPDGNRHRPALTPLRSKMRPRVPTLSSFLFIFIPVLRDVLKKSQSGKPATNTHQSTQIKTRAKEQRG
jgi:hypothetical protein